MAKTIYLLLHQNYFNRTIERYELVSDYLRSTVCGEITNMSLWNPNDGVETEITSNLGITAVPDYAIVTEGETVLQRWYVIKARRIAGQQFRLKLWRDVLAEEKNLILANPFSYVLRGWCDVSDPAIYNAEQMTFNQIKQSQTAMYDKSCTPWIVGYYVSNPEDEAKEITFSVPGTANVTYKFTIPAGGVRNASDAPYTIFFMPYETITVNDRTGITVTTITQPYQISRWAANALSKAFSGSGKLLDLQILPYCPVNAILDGYREASNSAGLTPNLKIYNSQNEVVGYLFTTTETSTAGTIYKIAGGSGTPLHEEQLKITVDDIKTESLTKFARIVSPNGNGVWEYVPAKQVYANGAASGFMFLMSAMPYQPYIKVEPESFGRLYGQNFQDSRGLICGGDFSMPQITDAWATYQINNKNYQAMFNRQIESLDLQQKWQGAQDVAGAISGTIGGIASGALLGGGTGAVIGGLASAAGGALDIYANQELRADTRDAAITQHNLQLDNVRALPYGVTKATNFNIEQPKVPYLEQYGCTDEELDNLNSYLDMKGYAINRYGRIMDYLKSGSQTWIQAIPVKLEDILDDAHYAAAIADEMKQGFYITEGV